MFGADAVAAFYTFDASVQAVAATLLALVAGYHVFDALQVVTVSALRGYKRAVVPLLVNVGGLWGVGLAGGYVIGLTDALDLSAARTGSTIGRAGILGGGRRRHVRGRRGHHHLFLRGEFSATRASEGGCRRAWQRSDGQFAAPRANHLL